MKTRNTLVSTVGLRSLLAGLLLGMASMANASLLIADNFTRSGPSEVVIAPFSDPSTPTVNSYSGLVEIIVSGFGASLQTCLNDAFYGRHQCGALPIAAPYDSQFYQLNIGWPGANLVPLVGEPRNIDNFIEFIDGVGAVAPGTRPAFNPTGSEYHFVVDTTLLAPLALQFGVSDGMFNDNTGSFRIEVFQLGAPGQAPEPVSFALLALGLALLSYSRRARAVTLPLSR